jgi:hypothetical protein
MLEHFSMKNGRFDAPVCYAPDLIESVKKALQKGKLEWAPAMLRAPIYKQANFNCLGSVHEHVVQHLVAVGNIAVGLLLALNAVCCPWYRRNSLRADFLFAMQAGAE